MSIRSSFISEITFPLLASYRGLNGLRSNIRFLESSQFWSAEKLHDFQQEKLKEILIYAYENTVYYRKIFSEAGFNPYRFRHPDEICKIPFLTKEIIRENYSDLLSVKYSDKERHCSETGGTTGVKMVFCRDNECLSMKEASLLRFDTWTGWKIGEVSSLVWPAQQDYVGNYNWKSRIINAFYLRQLVCPAAVIDEDLIKGYLGKFQIQKPKMIRAFPSPIHEIAQYVLKNQMELPGVKGIVTTGEPLLRQQREEISQAFQGPVFDSYRTREMGPVAQECEQHYGLHVNAETLFVEIIPGDESTPDDETGEVVVTDLLNRGMPFIRYQIGDYARFLRGECDCGRKLPQLETIEGRTGDVFITPDNRRIMAGSLVLYLIDESPGKTGQVQILQDRLDHLTILSTGDPPLSNQIKEYQYRKVKELFGKEMQISFKTVESIPREPGGKYRFAKCTVSR